MNRFCALLLLMISLYCSGQEAVSYTNDSTVVTEYIDGDLWIYKNYNGFIVGVTNNVVKDDYGKYYQLGIYIKNVSDTSIIFDPDKVEAMFIDKYGDEHIMDVYTNEEFQKKIKKKQRRTSIFAGIAEGLNAGIAGYSTSYSTDYSPQGYAYTKVTRNYDANAAYVANQNMNNRLSSLQKQMDTDKIIKESGYLKKNTIYPGTSIAGYMNVKHKKGQHMIVNIPVGSEIYTFGWDIQKKKK